MLDLFRDLFGFMREHRKFWLMPIFALLIFLGALMIMAQGSPLAPFIYTLF